MKLSFSKNVATDALQRAAVDPNSQPTPAEKRSLSKMVSDFAQSITPNMSMPNFSAKLQSFRESVANMFGKKTTPVETANFANNSGIEMISGSKTSIAQNTQTKTTAKTVRDKNGMTTTSWPIDSNGYTREVIKNKTGQVTETVTHPYSSKLLQNYENRLITNYKHYDIDNPDSNFQPGNVISSLEMTDNHVEYKIYNEDGSYSAYKLYNKEFFDNLTNTLYKKGDIEIQSSDPRERFSSHIKKGNSDDYKKAIQQVHTIVDQFNTHIIFN